MDSRAALLVGAAKVCAPRFFATGILPVVGERRGGRSGDASRGQHLCATCGSSDRQRRGPPQVGSHPDNGEGKGSREGEICSVWTPTCETRLILLLVFPDLRRRHADPRRGPTVTGTARRQPHVPGSANVTGDDGYPLESWLVVLVNGRPYTDSAEVQLCTTSLRSIVEHSLLSLPDFAESRLATTSDQPTLSGVFCSSCCFVVASGVLPLEVDLHPLLVLGLLLYLDPKRRSPQAVSGP
ncbi:hypothetical protein MRX96_020800 [Rhipicephalus microplus]